MCRSVQAARYLTRTEGEVVQDCDLGRRRGAGDGMRTRTISLGISAGMRLTSTAAGGRPGRLVREYPRSAPGDLPIGHVAGTGQGWAYA
jgi:hypothetical protein